MILKIKTAPAVEPVTLTDVKRQLKMESATVADNLTVTQSIAPGSHVIAASYSLVGTGVSVAGYGALVSFKAGTNGANGTVDVKIQESDDNATYADWTGGAFAQVTTANDNATYEKEYTGVKPYIRVVCTVAAAACEFGVDIITQGQDRSDDAYITTLIKTVRKLAEKFIGRAFITQTWYGYLDDWPDVNKKSGIDEIVIPLPPLQSVTSVKYYDTEDAEYTLDATTYYVDTDSEPGRIILEDGETWPSETLRPKNPIVIEFVAGYGATGASVEEELKQFMLLNIGNLYKNRDSEVGLIGEGLIGEYRQWGF